MSAATVGVTAECGKTDEGYHYEAVVQTAAAWGVFIRLQMGLWSPNRLARCFEKYCFSHYWLVRVVP